MSTIYDIVVSCPISSLRPTSLINLPAILVPSKLSCSHQRWKNKTSN